MPALLAERLDILPKTKASCGCDKSCRETSPNRWNCLPAFISSLEQFNWSIVPLTSISSSICSLKLDSAGTNGEISFNVMCEGNVWKENRTLLVNCLNAPKLS